MKNQVKNFNQYIKESDEFGTRMNSGARRSGPNAGNGIAVVEHRFGMGNNSTIVTFGRESIELEDNDEYGDGSGLAELFDTAAKLGASSDMVWLVGDNKILFKDISGKSNRG